MKTLRKIWMCVVLLPLAAGAQAITPLQTTRAGMLSVRNEPVRRMDTALNGYYVWQPCGFTVPAERIVYVDERGYTIVRILPARRETRWVRVWVPVETRAAAPRTATPSDRPGYMHPMNTWRSRP